MRNLDAVGLRDGLHRKPASCLAAGVSPFGRGLLTPASTHRLCSSGGGEPPGSCNAAIEFEIGIGGAILGVGASVELAFRGEIIGLLKATTGLCRPVRVRVSIATRSVDLRRSDRRPRQRCALMQPIQRVSTSRRSPTGGFDRLLPDTARDWPLRKTPIGTILPRNDPESGKCRIKQRSDRSSRAPRST
jgi:hypothetical protein